jgi:TonB-dependent SusC/RagA subfamily outer membrane receptor
VGAFFLLAALAACGRELPTAQEIRDVDVATAETAVRGVMGTENLVYTIDGVPTTRVRARSLPPSEIAEIVVSRGETDSRIEIVTKQGAAQGLHAEARPSAPDRVRKGDGEVLVLIDGVRASRGALQALPPEQVASVAVLRDSASTAGYGPDGVNGVMLITTRAAGAPPQPRKLGIVRGADGRILSVSLPQPASAPTAPPSFYLIDGVRADESTFRAIPRRQVENIRVVKGSEAREEYGEEGGNGVVVVTTRK